MQAVSVTNGSPEPFVGPTNGRLRAARFLGVHVALLVAALVATPFLRLLPAELAGLHHFGPFIALALAGAIALSFNRSRAAIAIACLAGAYGLHAGGSLRSEDAFTAVFVAVPLLLAGISLLRERGVFNRYGIRRLAVLGGVVAFVAATVSNGTWAWLAGAHPALFEPVFGGRLSLVAMLAVVLAAAGAAWSLWTRTTSIDAALVLSVLAFGTGGLLFDLTHGYGWMIGTAAACITVGVLQDAYRLAFVDELTGLGGRRALNEKLLTLGDRYTIAMVDVDHFKHVNDDFGHDTGDQVLRMIAAHLSRAGGGGRAYRYGGEEFAVVFPGKTVRDAVPHLEALRTSVEDYRMQLRGEDRPGESDEGRVRRGHGSRSNILKVTISIGVAERDTRHQDPDQVLRLADQALYRAKNRGRNRLSR